MSDPIEITTRYATTVDDLPAAWAFVMERLDSCGDHPSIEIRPVSTIGVADMLDGLDGQEGGTWQKRFEVVVEGMVTT